MTKTILEKAYSYYRDFEHLIDTSSCFLLILAFVIVLPTMQEFQLAWLGTLITFFVAIKIVFSRIERENPRLRLEEEFRRSLEVIDNKIKIIERRITKK